MNRGNIHVATESSRRFCVFHFWKVLLHTHLTSLYKGHVAPLNQHTILLQQYQCNYIMYIEQVWIARGDTDLQVELVAAYDWAKFFDEVQ